MNQKCSKTDMRMLNTGKAGMEDVDVQRANEIILQASKGSSFYLRQQEKQEEIEKRIQQMKKNKDTLSKDQLLTAKRKMDALSSMLEEQRDLDHIIVHIDMDAFYAAVEMRDDPNLMSKPMAVGSLHMLSTSNYHARKFGVRAAMPGFIAKKLCPELVIVPLNFDKYIQVSKTIQAILATYDPQYSPAGLDEAYLDVTAIVTHRHQNTTDKTIDVIAQEIVSEIRQTIQDKTNLTASAGIAPNKRLAKICSNINKPNGQFMIEFEHKKILSFIENTPISKVCGIGNVTGQLLHSLEIQTCADLWKQRDVLSLLFSEVSAENFLRISLGLGSTCVPSDDVKKSMSVERTFKNTDNLTELKMRCEELCTALSTDLKNENLMGRTITVKLKTSSFHVKTKAKSLACHTSSFDVINSTAQALLEDQLRSKKIQMRLMGVRLSNLLSENGITGKQQSTLDDFIKNAEKKMNSLPFSVENNNEFICQLCGCKFSLPEITIHTEQCLKNRRTDTPVNTNESSAEPTYNNAVLEHDSVLWLCPICGIKQNGVQSLVMFNQHIDDCLSKKAVKEVLDYDNCLYYQNAKRSLLSKSPVRKKTKTVNDFTRTTKIDKFLK